uniref:Uncharacterized protein n=1 Tax=Triticum urartu TaxID=4572 RepID=A0A8R7PTM2_TRIUA
MQNKMCKCEDRPMIRVHNLFLLKELLYKFVASYSNCEDMIPYRNDALVFLACICIVACRDCVLTSFLLYFTSCMILSVAASRFC